MYSKQDVKYKGVSTGWTVGYLSMQHWTWRCMVMFLGYLSLECLGRGATWFWFVQDHRELICDYFQEDCKPTRCFCTTSTSQIYHAWRFCASCCSSRKLMRVGVQNCSTSSWVWVDVTVHGSTRQIAFKQRLFSTRPLQPAWGLSYFIFVILVLVVMGAQFEQRFWGKILKSLNKMWAWSFLTGSSIFV